MKKFLIASGVAVLAFASIAGAQAFSANLTVGSQGADVVALQTALINGGYNIPAIASGAAAKGYFGSQTKTAVMAYQAAKGIPNTGFVGPLTRAALNAGGSVVPPVSMACPVGMVCTPIGGGTPVVSTGGLAGGEGSLENFDLIGSISGEEVDEGENDTKVLGVEFDAEDSDLRIDRVDVDFTAPASGSDHLDDYITEVSLWLGNTKIGTKDVDEGDEDNNDIFSFRFTGISGVVRENDTASLYVAVSGVNNVDSNDTGSWTVEIPENGIRATDGAGISDTYVSGTDDLSEDFSVGASNSGELDVSEGSANPTAGIITVSEDNDTSDVSLLALDLEADESDITIDELQVGLVSSGANVSEIVKSVKLMKGSTVLDSKTITSVSATTRYVIFDDLNLTIEDGDTETLMVVADVNELGGNFTEGDSIYALATSSATWDVEDANNDTVTPDGDVTGNAQTFYTDGIIVTLSDTDATAENGVATFEVAFNLKANGSDVYVSANSPDATTTAVTAGTAIGVQYATSTTASGTGVVSSDDLLSAFKTGDSTGTYYKVAKGTTRAFKLQVVMSNNSTSTLAKDLIALQSINWGTTTSAINQHYTYNLGEFMTDPLSWKTNP